MKKTIYASQSDAVHCLTEAVPPPYGEIYLKRTPICLAYALIQLATCLG